jgi:3-keto-disaccharide hydrolase
MWVSKVFGEETLMESSRPRFNRFGKGPWKDVAGYRDPNGDPEKPHGQWNVVELLSDGDHITYWVNGKLVNEGTDASVTRGKILFQSEGAEVSFRNIEIHSLKK